MFENEVDEWGTDTELRKGRPEGIWCRETWEGGGMSRVW